MSLRLTPAPSHPSHTTPEHGAPSAPGVHDVLRSRLSLTSTPITAVPTTSSAKLTSTHPLESRLANWRATQDELKMNLLRRQFGIAEPVRRGMELDIVRRGEWRPNALNVGRGGCVSEDILTGRDCEVGWEDVFCTAQETEERDLGMHSELERRVGMGA